MLGHEFITRRKKLLERIGSGNAAVLFSSEEIIRNGDVHFPFRQNSDFFYFTAFPEPEAVAVFLPGRKEGEFVLFNRPRDQQIERWTGPRIGQQGACDIFGADEAYDTKQLKTKILELLVDRKVLFYPFNHSKGVKKVNCWLQTLRHNRKYHSYPHQLSDLGLLTSEMRLIKSQHEIDLLKQAAEISAVAHCKLMAACQPGVNEYELEALFDYEIKTRQGRFPAYTSIVGGGENACILHYIDNQSVLRDGDLVLVDAGAEYQHYAADITRTYPVNGKFNAQQSAIYDLVLSAQLAVIREIKPGIRWHRLQEIAVTVLTEGLVSLGILKGRVSDLIEQKAYLEYYMHNIGHWLGLDVHDVGAYKVNSEWRSLEPGMVLTVEPGLYLSPNNHLGQQWWHIGVRIEDDIVVTENGCEVLSEAVPKSIQDIQILMNSKRALA